MHDLNRFRGDLPTVEERLRARGLDPAVVLGDFHRLDADRRARITRAEALKAERNSLSDEVGRARRAGTDATAIMEEVRRLKVEGETLEAAAAEAEEQLRTTLAALPNLPAADVPAGKDETANVEIKRWRVPPHFGFAPKAHYELGEALGVLDFERAAKLSGARFAVLWADGARLERALAQWMLAVQTEEHGYTEVAPPLMVNSRSLFGTGQLPKFADDLFRAVDEEGFTPSTLRENDHWLIPTAEVPLTNLLRDEIVDGNVLPLSLTACTPCFRSEAGSYGRDVRGIIRQHQFTKVELVKFAKPDESEEAHEQMTRDAETILERLELPYRRMLLCAGDMGFSAAKTYDLEVWLPGQGTYREISSVSNCEAFQARRANIRFRNAKGKAEHLHTLNGSGLAVGRTWVAVLENYQQEDGSVRVPDVLRPYMGGLDVIRSREKGF
jgi:seryl-tRNA synthetase